MKIHIERADLERLVQLGEETCLEAAEPRDRDLLDRMQALLTKTQRREPR